MQESRLTTSNLLRAPSSGACIAISTTGGQSHDCILAYPTARLTLKRMRLEVRRNCRFVKLLEMAAALVVAVALLVYALTPSPSKADQQAHWEGQQFSFYCWLVALVDHAYREILLMCKMLVIIVCN